MLSIDDAHAVEPVQVTTLVEAWYTVPPLEPACVLPLCRPPAEPLPSSPSLLHIGVANGVETDRSFIVLDLAPVAGLQVTGGRLTLPLAAPATGATPPEEAELLACGVYGAVTAANGTAGPGPGFDCSTSEEASYEPPPPSGEGHGQLIVDLSSFAEAWDAGEPAAIVVLPATSSAQQTPPTWRFVLQGRPEAQASSPISAVLEVAADTGTTTPPAGAQPAGAQRDVSAGPVPARSSVAVAAPAAPATPERSGVGTSQEAAIPASGAQLALPTTVGFSYAVVLLLPLVYLFVGGTLGRSLIASVPRLAVEHRSSIGSGETAASSLSGFATTRSVDRALSRHVEMDP